MSGKYNIGLLKPYFDPIPQPESENTNVPSDEKPPDQDTENPDKSDLPHSQEAVPKVNSSDERHCHPRKHSREIFECAIDSNVWSKLPDEIAEKILVLSVQNSDKPVSTYQNLSRTFFRFNTLLHRRSHHLLPRVHLKFSESDYKKLDKYNSKIKVSVRRIVIVFGEFSDASQYISNAINDKNWKSAWLLLKAEKHSQYFIRRAYWKRLKSGAADPIIIKDANDANWDDNSDKLG